mgnify:CR=1 FL=1
MKLIIIKINKSFRWGQVYIIEVLTQYTPKDSNEAETIAERVGPRLNHANSSVILSAIKVLIFITDNHLFFSI